MADVVTVSSSSTGNTTGTGITLTKPTGLAEGDILLSIISTKKVTGGNDPITTAAGWTGLSSQVRDGTNADVAIVSQYKIADASDVAAANFSFSNTSATSCVIAGALMRVTGNRPTGALGVYESDASAPTSATISFTGASTPASVNSLVVLGFVAAGEGSNGVGTISGYTTTPSVTFTEVLDYGDNAGTSDSMTGIAYGNLATPAEITAYGATLSLSREVHAGLLVTIYPVVDAQGTNTLLSVSPTTFTQNGVADGNGTTALLEVSPTIPTQSGKAQNTTQWTSATKNTTTWTNTNKS